MNDATAGPRIGARSGPAQQLVVFLHGYGADGQDLIEIGRAWQDSLPRAAFFAPHAPELCRMGAGRQWFDLTFRDPGERWRGVNRAAPALDAILDRELARHALAPDRLALVGFSQGTMMALHVGLRRQTPLAAIVGFSGMLVEPEPPAAPDESSFVQPPPVLLLHGDSDDIIPVDALFLSTERLAARQAPTEWHLALGIGHGIDPDSMRHAAQFLASRFGRP